MLEINVIIILYSLGAALFLTSSNIECVGPKEKIFDSTITVVGYLIMIRDLHLHPEHINYHGNVAAISIFACLLVMFDQYCRRKLEKEDDDFSMD